MKITWLTAIFLSELKFGWCLMILNVIPLPISSSFFFRLVMLLWSSFFCMKPLSQRKIILLLNPLCWLPCVFICWGFSCGMLTMVSVPLWGHYFQFCELQYSNVRFPLRNFRAFCVRCFEEQHDQNYCIGKGSVFRRKCRNCDPSYFPHYEFSGRAMFTSLENVLFCLRIL